MAKENAAELCEIHSALRTIKECCERHRDGCHTCPLYDDDNLRCRVAGLPGGWKVRKTAEVIEVVKIFEED